MRRLRDTLHRCAPPPIFWAGAAAAVLVAAVAALQGGWLHRPAAAPIAVPAHPEAHLRPAGPGTIPDRAVPPAPAPPIPPAAPLTPVTWRVDDRPRAAVSAVTAAPALVAVGVTRPADREGGGRPAGAGQTAAVAAIFDTTGWDWRRAGITIRIGYHPQACCHWGIYDRTTATVWVGPSAFATPARLRYVALHELAHGWQFHSGHPGTVSADMAPFGWHGTDAYEAGADCVAAHWGAPTGHYWACPPAAQAVAARRLAGDWA